MLTSGDHTVQTTDSHLPRGPPSTPFLTLSRACTVLVKQNLAFSQASNLALFLCVGGGSQSSGQRTSLEKRLRMPLLVE